MSALKVALHKEAIAEARAAREWYEIRSAAAAEAFMQELDRIVARIGAYPEGGAPYLEGTRRYLMQRFLSPWYIAKSDEHTKLSQSLTAEGNLATGRAASSTEEHTIRPANNRLERTAEKRGRSAAGR
jgi:plasmid stabilization system protein ParE